MEKMYQDYKDVAEFRLVYIKEAHAMDSSWPVEYAKEMGIKEHTSYGERCTVATKLLSDKNLSIPTLADDMNDSANNSYKGWPDRVFLVKKDGTLAVAAKRGPWGFKPGLDAAKTWLASFKETGIEPPNKVESADADSRDTGSAKTPAQTVKLDPKAAATVVGTWEMKTEFRGGKIPATMSLKLEDKKLVGTWSSQGMDMKMKAITLDGNTISFKRSIGEGGPSLAFTGTLNGDKLDGKFSGMMGEMKCAGTMKKPTDATESD